jgi:hypothetical protein
MGNHEKMPISYEKLINTKTSFEITEIQQKKDGKEGVVEEIENIINQYGGIEQVKKSE